jgi:hypothetical protein
MDQKLASQKSRVPEIPALYSGNGFSGKETPLNLPETGKTGIPGNGLNKAPPQKAKHVNGLIQ